MITPFAFEAVVAFLGAMVCAACSLLYFQRVRLDRPAIGVFNGRDIAVLLSFIVVLPFLYIIIPPLGLIGVLTLTFVCAMYVAMRPLVRPRYIWLTAVALLGSQVLVTYYAQHGWSTGWQVYWVILNLIVLIAAVGVSNLYVQGGMRLRHVAWFALLLGVYDITFTWVYPLTPILADHFIGKALDPSIGFQMGFYRANIGLGDLLVYCLFTVAAYKGFGKRGAIAAFITIPIFGVLVPAFAPFLIIQFVRAGIGVVVPAQTAFGPVAFLTYLWLKRSAPERSMAEWFKVQNAALAKEPAISAAQPGQVKQPALAEVQSSAQGTD